MSDLPERIRSEADIAARTGQYDRLHAIADEVEATARLVDDMAAVIRRLDVGWDPILLSEEWRLRINGFSEKREPMSPGDVAALHHARQQDDR